MDRGLFGLPWAAIGIACETAVLQHTSIDGDAAPSRYFPDHDMGHAPTQRKPATHEAIAGFGMPRERAHEIWWAGGFEPATNRL